MRERTVPVYQFEGKLISHEPVLEYNLVIVTCQFAEKDHTPIKETKDMRVRLTLELDFLDWPAAHHAYKERLRCQLWFNANWEENGDSEPQLASGWVEACNFHFLPEPLRFEIVFFSTDTRPYRPSAHERAEWLLTQLDQREHFHPGYREKFLRQLNATESSPVALPVPASST